MSVLHSLVETGNLATLWQCLEREENPNIQDENGDTPLHLVALKMVENLQEIDQNDAFALMLIHFGADVDLENNDGNTPLHFAVVRRKYTLIEILLQHNARILLNDNEGNTALHYAIISCALLGRENPEYVCLEKHFCTNRILVEQFLEHHPDINVANNRKETPLMWAVKTGDFRIVQQLSQKGALQNQRDVDGNTALHYAVIQPELNIDIVRELLKYGSFPGIFNKRKRIPLDLYLEKLQGVSPSERKRAADLFKVLLLQRNFLEENQIKLMYKQELEYILKYCRYEIFKMQSDKISSCYSVYDIVTWNYAFNGQIPYKCWNKLLDKLLEGKYHVYCDIIISCFPPFYLNRKFAEICCWEVRNNVRKEFLNYDMRLWLSRNYLSPVDAYNMMVAGQ